MCWHVFCSALSSGQNVVNVYAQVSDANERGSRIRRTSPLVINSLSDRAASPPLPGLPPNVGSDSERVTQRMVGQALDQHRRASESNVKFSNLTSLKE